MAHADFIWDILIYQSLLGREDYTESRLFSIKFFLKKMKIFPLEGGGWRVEGGG